MKMCMDCQGRVEDTDDSIYYPIKILNQKGYETEFSCSGHTWGGDPYIVFDRIVHKDCFVSYPAGFNQTYNDFRIKISREIKASAAVEKQKEINEAAQSLIEWSKQLPIANKVRVHLDQYLYELDSKLLKALRDELHLCPIIAVRTSAGKSFSIFCNETGPESTDKLVQAIQAFTTREKLKCKIETEQFIPSSK